ncbi:caspase family protein [Taibaiella lutea]|uniref:Caspase family protein n=1 Tax=Taibaiella lutea TaxID=2608001 RepID=A0A5M6CJA0_9BACT|nr:caspase family protein [Taibaiella lutea]KAA5535106.1 caspase family protein [Taibaiella lutea]
MKRALLVGIDNYPYSPLYSSVKDATNMAYLLEWHANGTKNFDVKLETEVFTKAVLRKLIVELFSGDEETVLFYFSGHGLLNVSGGHIVTPDRKDYDEGILLDEILRLANNCKARNKIIILDSCHSGALGFSDSFGAEKSYIGEGITIMTASRSHEPALAKGYSSVFTSLLIEALKGGAADITGQITPGAIYAYIDQALGPFDQRPVFKTNTTRFSPLRKVSPLVSPEALNNITEYFITDETEHNLDPSYEETNIADIKPFLREPYATPKKIAIFKHLQQMERVGLLQPVDTPFLFFAAMDSKSCKLTPLGRHYWRLVKNKKLRL